MTKLNFELLLPGIRPWVMNLVNIWPAYIVKPQYANWEVLHILSLTLLGGTAILMNLRLLNAGIVEDSPSEVYHNLRRWQDLGVFGIIVTGILIGMANAEKLYDSTAFVVKMCALFGGIILTYGASRPVARADGAVSGAAKLWFVVGAALWLVGLAILVSGALINVGIYHVLTAAALVALMVLPGRARWIWLAGLLLIIGVQEGVTHLAYKGDDIAHLDPVNKVFSWLFGLWILAGIVWRLMLTRREERQGVYVQLIAWSTILVWITGGAAGRWIAFE
jgi:hypothetical protein